MPARATSTCAKAFAACSSSSSVSSAMSGDEYLASAESRAMYLVKARVGVASWGWGHGQREGQREGLASVESSGVYRVPVVEEDRLGGARAGSLVAVAVAVAVTVAVIVILILLGGSGSEGGCDRRRR